MGSSWARETAQALDLGGSLGAVLFEPVQEGGMRGGGILGAQLRASLGITWADLALGRGKGCEQRWGAWESQHFEGSSDKPVWLKGYQEMSRGLKTQV